MGEWVFYAGIAAAFVTLGVLVWGIAGFGTGKMTPQRQNKMMMARIGAQAAAVALLFIAFALMG